MTVDGQRVFYRAQGEGESVVLLHGWASSGELFEPLIALLSGCCRVLAPDFPGMGQSPEPPAAWCVDDYADWLCGFLKAMGVKRCALVGHSFGGRVILKLAARRLPEPELTKLVLIDAAGLKPAPTKQGAKRAGRYQLAKKLLQPFPGAMERLRRRHGSADYNAASPLMRQVLVKTVNEDLAPLLPLVRPPTLLIWGRNDTATPLADGQRMEREIPGAALVVLENAGHYAFLEQQAQFLRVMASFFNAGGT